jgi:hypothetical protein
MDWSQLVFTALLLLAIRTGRPKPIVTFAMVGNLAATMLLSLDPLDVAVADLVAVILLVGASARANIVAALFVAMMPVYIMGAALGLQPWVIYTAVDVLAIMQCGVLGGWDRWIWRMGHRRGSGDRRRAGGAAAVAQRSYASDDTRVSDGPSGGRR